MSRDRTLGPIWARVHRRYGSPAWGTVLIAVIAAGVAALTLMIPKLNEAVLACVNAIGTLVAFYYGLTSIACALRFRGLLRTNRREALRAVVVPAVCGLLLLALDGYLVVYYATLSDTFAVSASNGWFCLACPAAIIVAGLVIGAIAKWRRRSPYFDRPAETAGPDAGLPAIADRPAH
jgi:amino acid transporter